MRTDLGHVSIRNLGVEKWAGRLVLLALWLAGGAALAIDRVQSLTSCVAPVALLAGTALLLAYRQGRSLVGARRRGASGSMTAFGDVLEVERLGRVVRVSRADVIAGWTEPGVARMGDEIVLLTRGGLEVRLALLAGGGEELLRAAGVAAEQRAVKIRVSPGDTGLVRLALIACVTCLAPLVFLSTAGTGLAFLDMLPRQPAGSGIDPWMAAPFAFGTFVFGGSIWLLLQRLSTTTLTIGTDGVVVQQLGLRRVVPRAAVTRVEAIQGIVVLRRTGGAPLRVYSSPAAATAVASRIQAALEVTHEAPAAPVERLDRRDRPVAEWLGELRALARDGSGYRDVAFDRQALFAVVKDGAAPAERRLAAAAALSTRRDDEDRAALRIAADTCADERLRVVLDHAAEAELGEEELEEAAAKLSAAR